MNKSQSSIILRGSVCKDFMINKRCEKNLCKKIHDKDICYFHWKFNTCKYDAICKKKHLIYTSKYDKNHI